MSKEGAELTSAGRAFQTRAPATEKARRPTVGSLTAGTHRSSEVTYHFDWQLHISIHAHCLTLSSCSLLSTRQLSVLLTESDWLTSTDVWNSTVSSLITGTIISTCSWTGRSYWCWFTGARTENWRNKHRLSSQRSTVVRATMKVNRKHHSLGTRTP